MRYVLFAALLILAAAGGRADDSTVVSARVAMPDGQRVTWDLADSAVRFLSYAGQLSLPLGNIRSLTRQPGQTQMRLETTHGDVWQAELLDRSLRLAPRSGAGRSVDLHAWPFTSLTNLCADSAAWSPREHLELVFRDGSKAIVDPGDLVFDVVGDDHAWRLPLGSIRVIKILYAAGGEDVRAVARFPGGQIARFSVTGRRPYFEARDTFGNRLKVHFEDVRGLLCRIGIDDAPVDGVATQAPAADAGFLPAVVTGADGLGREVGLPCTSLTVSGALGDVLLPLAQVRAVMRDDRSGGATVTTVYGDVLAGSVSPRTLPVYPAGAARGGKAGEIRLWLDQQERIELSSPRLRVPAGWLVFHLDSGERIAARPATDEGGFRGPEGGAGIAWSSLAIAQSARGGAYAVALGDGTTRLARPVDRSLDVALLCNGMRARIPWRHVRRIGANPADLQFEAAALPGVEAAGDVPLADEAVTRQTDGLFEKVRRLLSAQPGDTRKADGAAAVGARPATDGAGACLTLRTGFGELRVPLDLISVVRSSTRAGVSSATTVYGDAFKVPLIARPDVRRLRPQGDATTDLKHVPAEIVRDAVPREPPAGWLAWRLRSGDVFHARPVDDSLRVAPRRGGRPVDILCKRLMAIAPTGEDCLRFVTDSGEIEGRPDTRALDVVLLVDPAITNRVAFRDLEQAVAAPLTALAPPVAVTPAAAPVQEGTVGVPSGSFTMGRTEGVGMDDEQPAFRVGLSAFFMDACEVTRAQFAAFVEAAGYRTEAETRAWGQTWRNPGFAQGDDEPVVCVSWFDAARYCNWRSERAGLDPCYEFTRQGDASVCRRDLNGYRLPTEAEWEYAARSGGRDFLYPWGAETNAAACAELANFQARPGLPSDVWTWTCPVKAFAPNGAGLYGMGGNAWEWCQDWYAPNGYAGLRARRPQDPCNDDATQPREGMRRVMRGGSFQNEIDLLRCASRGSGLPRANSSRVGFRCVRNAERGP